MVARLGDWSSALKSPHWSSAFKSPLQAEVDAIRLVNVSQSSLNCVQKHAIAVASTKATECYTPFASIAHSLRRLPTRMADGDPPNILMLFPANNLPSVHSSLRAALDALRVSNFSIFHYDSSGHGDANYLAFASASWYSSTHQIVHRSFRSVSGCINEGWLAAARYLLDGAGAQSGYTHLWKTDSDLDFRLFDFAAFRALLGYRAPFLSQPAILPAARAGRASDRMSLGTQFVPGKYGGGEKPTRAVLGRTRLTENAALRRSIRDIDSGKVYYGRNRLSEDVESMCPCVDALLLPALYEAMRTLDSRNEIGMSELMNRIAVHFAESAKGASKANSHALLRPAGLVFDYTPLIHNNTRLRDQPVAKLRATSMTVTCPRSRVMPELKAGDWKDQMQLPHSILAHGWWQWRWSAPNPTGARQLRHNTTERATYPGLHSVHATGGAEQPEPVLHLYSPPPPTPVLAAIQLTFMKPTDLATWVRFDVYVKLAYASFVIEHGLLNESGRVPGFVSAVYLEHERILNRFSETCKPKPSGRMARAGDRRTASTHPECHTKRGPRGFVRSFHTLLLNMADNGYSTDPRAAVPVCPATSLVNQGLMPQSRFVPVNGHHRIAAAIALGIRFIPVTNATASICQKVIDHHYFRRSGFLRPLSDWVVHRAILADKALHVLHVWPRAVVRGGSGKMAEARLIMARNCSTENGVVYEKEVYLSSGAVSVYLEHAYGAVPWLRKATFDRYKKLPGNGSSDRSPAHVFVLRSSLAKMTLCKKMLREHFGLGGSLYKAAAHGTDTHSEAILASQMLLHDTSVEYLHLVARNVSQQKLNSHFAREIAREIAAHYVGPAPPRPHAPPHQPMRVNSSHKRPQIFVLPEGVLVDAGAAMRLAGLRSMVSDVDLVWSRTNQVAGAEFARACRPLSAGCSHKYGRNNFRYHRVPAPEDLLFDPTRHAFYYGLKFVVPAQLAAYKRHRLAAGSKRDRRDLELLTETCRSEEDTSVLCCGVPNPMPELAAGGSVSPGFCSNGQRAEAAYAQSKCPENPSLFCGQHVARVLCHVRGCFVKR